MRAAAEAADAVQRAAEAVERAAEAKAERRRVREAVPAAPFHRLSRMIGVCEALASSCSGRCGMRTCTSRA